MTMLAKKTNELQQFVLENGLDKRSMKQTSIDADSNIVKDFPRLAEEDIRELTIGVYQLNAALYQSYAAEHLTDGVMFENLVSNDVPNIVCAKIQSRHTSSKKYSLWIKYCETIVSQYCTCRWNVWAIILHHSEAVDTGLDRKQGDEAPKIKTLWIRIRKSSQQTYTQFVRYMLCVQYEPEQIYERKYVSIN